MGEGEEGIFLLLTLTRTHARVHERRKKEKEGEGRRKERGRRGRRSSPPPYVPMRAGGREEKGERRGCPGVSLLTLLLVMENFGEREREIEGERK